MRKLMQSLARRLLPAANLEITLPTGIRVPVGSRDQVSRFEEIFLGHAYDEFIDRLGPLESVCDLGCNAGFFPLAIENRKRAKSQAKRTRYVCVDANPACLKIARRALERNLPTDSWEVVAGCVGEPGQKMSFHVSKADAHSSVLTKYSFAKTITMTALDLNAFFRDHFSSGIDLLKVDIEGAERFLVVSWGEALQQYCRRIMVEYHPFCGMTAAEFGARLEKLGFKAEIFQPDATGEQLGLFIRS